MVSALKDEDTALRMSASTSAKPRTPSGFSEKRQKTSKEAEVKNSRRVIDSSSEDENVIESTASQ
jgi:hypothetical protein